MDLRKLQLTQLEILKIIDKVCRDNDISYSLYAGTLLGAVRHQGFIPWDDDLDICMSRKDYDHFLEAWETEHPDGYILQNKENTPSFTQSFSKIRKDHTTFLQYEFERGRYHTGIFVDIFPLDRIPDGNFKRTRFFWDCMRYQLYTREFVPPLASKPVKAVSSVLLKTKNAEARREFRQKLLKRLTQNNDSRSYHIVATETTGTMKQGLPNDLLDGYTELEFEDASFMCFGKWKEYLEIKYGNYMKLPLEKDRIWKHHPIVLDFERNYDEL